MDESDHTTDSPSDIFSTMVSRFSNEDLRDFCFDLGIDWETIDGTNKKAKIREFLRYIQRTNQIDKLIEVGEEKRKDINWAKLTWPQSRFSPIEKRKIPRSLLYAALGIVLVGIVLFGSLIYFRYFRQRVISPDLTPSLLSFGEANAENIHYFENNPQLPASLDWYQFENSSLDNSDTPDFDVERVNAYLHFQPRLNAPHGWAAIFFWRTLWTPPLNLSGKNEILMIVHAETDDMVEITFKDAHGNEQKLGMPVVSDWAGYRIPFSEAQGVDFNRLQLFEIAYSGGVGSLGSNTFKIAYITFQP